MLFDTMVESGANTFIWIVCIVAGLGAAIGFADHLRTQRASENQEEE